MVLKGMRIPFILLLLGILYAFPVQSAELKIGAVSIGKILNEAPQAEQANKRLQEEFAPRERGLVDAQKSLRDMEQKLTRDGAVMSESQRRSLERDIRAEARELQRATEEFREDVNLRRNEELSKFQQEVVEVINGLAREEGFDLILNEGSVLYAGERVDITEKVLGKLSP
jgi:outer membrane protein